MTEPPRTLTRRKRLLVVGVLLGAGAVAVALFLLVGRNPVAYHNEAISAAAKADSVTLKIIPRELEDILAEVEITDPARVAWLAGLFRLDQVFEIERDFHSCDGHLTMTFRTGQVTHTIQYDHGSIFYPVYSGRNPGLVHMAPAVCDELNAYLLSLGFTNRQLGIYEPEKADDPTAQAEN